MFAKGDTVAYSDALTEGVGVIASVRDKDWSGVSSCDVHYLVKVEEKDRAQAFFDDGSGCLSGAGTCRAYREEDLTKV